MSQESPQFLAALRDFRRAHLSSNFNNLIRQTVCPVLVVPGAPAPLERVLLAYDGSAKAKEALFVSAYLAGKWEIPLVVLTVTEGERVAADVLAHAQDYLTARGVPADLLRARSNIPGTISRLVTAKPNCAIGMVTRPVPQAISSIGSPVSCASAV